MARKTSTRCSGVMDWRFAKVGLVGFFEALEDAHYLLHVSVYAESGMVALIVVRGRF